MEQLKRVLAAFEVGLSAMREEASFCLVPKYSHTYRRLQMRTVKCIKRLS